MTNERKPDYDPSTAATLRQHPAAGSEQMRLDTEELQHKYREAPPYAIAQLVEGRATRRITDSALFEIGEVKAEVVDHRQRIAQLETRPIVVSIAAPPAPPPMPMYSVPPPPVEIPARDPLTSTGQHAIVVAGAALKAAENAHQAAAAASVDYAREQERAKAEQEQTKAEIYKRLNGLAGDIGIVVAKWLGIGGFVAATLAAVAGYFATHSIAQDAGNAASKAVHQEAATVANETKQAVKQAVDESVQNAPKEKP